MRRDTVRAKHRDVALSDKGEHVHRPRRARSIRTKKPE